MRVLIADDSGIIRTIIARVLNSMGVRKITEVNDGAAAWHAYQKQAFGLVITDWHMPRIDGIDLTKLVRETNSDIPILMITVVDTRSQVIQALQAGVSDYLCKPFERDELEDKLEKYLRAGAP